MFKPIDNGSTENIQGLVCHLPPAGHVYNVLTGNVEFRGVYQRSPKKAEQYWEVIRPLVDYKKAREKEERMQARDPEYFDPDLEAYRNQEWDRRLNGFWFSNNGVPTYITGAHYFYLNHWYIDIGLPKYRDPDRKYFYFQQYCIEDPECFGMVEVTKRRGGKCFGKDTLIKMYDGSNKLVQDVKEGDLVMGNDSTPRMAYGITSGREKMYRIVPNKGEPFECNESHIISLIWNGATTHSIYGWEKNSIVNIPLKQYLGLKNWEKDHLVMHRAGWGKHFEEVKHKIPPYIMGVYLGDGCSTVGCISGIDIEVKHEIENYAKSIGHSVIQRDAVTYAIIKPQTQLLNDYRQALKYYNVLKNKHIPKEYIIDSENNRLELLAGIVDTDGYLSEKGNRGFYEITQKRKELADGIVELARSLGFYVRMRPKVATMKRNDGSVYSCVVYRISINGEINRIPCRIERKKAKDIPARVNSMRFGFKVDDIGEGYYYGFAVDGNHLFLLADGTVVHNTYRAGVFLYEHCSRTENARSGIQSKNGSDAKEVFRKAIIQPFKKLPDFFVPVYDQSKGLTPTSELRFYQTTVKGKKANQIKDEKELESMIDWKSSEGVSYDGQKIHRMLHDEAGKTTEVDVWQRYLVTRYCNLDDEGRIIGKHLITTTVEDMEQGGAAFKNIWANSDHTNKTGKRTASGLYRYFCPADETRYYDAYGFADRERALKEILEERQLLAGDARALSAVIRKEPLTWEEAFRIDGTKCIYNVIKLNERLDRLNWKDNLTTKGNFVWQNGERDTKVLWEPSRNGRWEVVKLFEKEQDSNNIIRRGGLYYPNNTLRFTMGVDPVDHNQTEDGRMSMGAGLVMQKYSAVNEEDPYNHAFVAKYVHRPDAVSVLYEDMLKAAVYYGANILFENNKIGMLNYFNDRGYEHFLIWLPERTQRGIAATTRAHQEIAELTEEYINNNIDKVYFKDLINDWINFDLSKTTKFDLAMAAGYALIADRYKVARKDMAEVKEVKEYFRAFKL